MTSLEVELMETRITTLISETITQQTHDFSRSRTNGNYLYNLGISREVNLLMTSLEVELMET